MLTTVFDVAQEGYLRDTPLLLIPMAGIIFSALLVFEPDVMQTLLPYGPRGRTHQILSRFMLSISIMVMLFFSFIVIRGNLWSISQLKSGQYSIVEGPVMDYTPPKSDGHGPESFTVGGHRFSYAAGDLTAGFRTPATQGGPIRQGRYVRISYAADVILRLETAKEDKPP